MGEPYLRVFVAGEFLASTHGRLGCVFCHGGDSTADQMKPAHQGLVRKPSEQPETYCRSCHPDAVARVKTSLHYTVSGLRHGLMELARDQWPQVEPLFQKNCQGCHASCGDCHVSRPKAARGGLLEGHRFFKSPPIELTCNGCHGGRVGPEFFGRNEGFPGDVHWEKAKMGCTDCHSREEIHGDGKTYQTRYQVPQRPRCLTCHPTAAPGQSALEAHNVHGEKVACGVCHGNIIRSCTNCHDGKARSRFDFKVGVTRRDGGPERYTLMRHVPTTRDLFGATLPGGLPGFDERPTWKETSPHNIQRVTPRNRTCEACHKNRRIFLRVDGTSSTEPRANSRVAVPHLPPPLERR